jgi:hypothetical protein
MVLQKNKDSQNKIQKTKKQLHITWNNFFEIHHFAKGEVILYKIDLIWYFVSRSIAFFFLLAILITEWSPREFVTIFMTMFGLQCEKQDSQNKIQKTKKQLHITWNNFFEIHHFAKGEVILYYFSYKYLWLTVQRYRKKLKMLQSKF